MKKFLFAVILSNLILFTLGGTDVRTTIFYFHHAVIDLMFLVPFELFVGETARLTVLGNFTEIVLMALAFSVLAVPSLMGVRQIQTRWARIWWLSVISIAMIAVVYVHFQGHISYKVSWGFLVSKLAFEALAFCTILKNNLKEEV